MDCREEARNQIQTQIDDAIAVHRVWLLDVRDLPSFLPAFPGINAANQSAPFARTVRRGSGRL